MEMLARSKPSLTLSAALAAGLVAAPAVHASAFTETFGDYRSDGRINACAYSEAQLRRAQGQVPPDIEQYAPDFPAALGSALSERAAGACERKPATATPAPAPTAPTPPADGERPTQVVTPQPPAPAKPPVAPDRMVARGVTPAASGAGSGPPAPVVALGVCSALLALAGLVWALARWGPWEPRWMLAARHAWGEAGFRTGATWAEFTDWVRLGR